MADTAPTEAGAMLGGGAPSGGPPGGAPSRGGPPLGEPVPFRILLDDGVRLTRRHLGRILLPVALPVAVAQVLLVVAQNRLMGELTVGGEPDPAALFGGLAALGCAAFLFLFIYGIAYSAMGAAAVDATAEREVEMRRSWRFVLRPRVLMTLVGMGVAVGLGMMCCFLPGLWLVMILGLALPVMVEEGEVLGSAWRRSSRLARYNPQRRLGTSAMLKIFVFMVVGFLISQAVGLVVQMPVVIAQQVIVFREVAAGTDPNALLYDARWLWLQVPATVVGSLAQTAVALYLSFGMALLYFDVRRRRDGDDLEAALDELEAR